VAGQDTVPDGPPMQREPHVGTAIVHSVDLALVEKERERTTSDSNGHATGRAYIVESSSSHEVS
jgi:hypothetical protein